MTEGGTSARADLWGGAGWAGLGLLIMAASWRMERFESMGAELYTMPGFVPGMFGIVLLLLGIALLLRSWRRSIRQTSAAPDEPLINRRIALMLALSLGYAIGLIGRVPFWLATAVFVAGFVACFAPREQTPTRRLVVSLLAGVLTSAVVSFTFQQIFLVRLP